MVMPVGPSIYRVLDKYTLFGVHYATQLGTEIVENKVSIPLRPRYCPKPDKHCPSSKRTGTVHHHEHDDGIGTTKIMPVLQLLENHSTAQFSVAIICHTITAMITEEMERIDTTRLPLTEMMRTAIRSIQPLNMITRRTTNMTCEQTEDVRQMKTRTEP